MEATQLNAEGTIGGGVENYLHVADQTHGVGGPKQGQRDGSHGSISYGGQASRLPRVGAVRSCA